MLLSAWEIIMQSWKFYAAHWKKLLPFMGVMFASYLIWIFEGERGILMGAGAAGLAVGVLLIPLMFITMVVAFWTSLSLQRATFNLLTTGSLEQWKEIFKKTLPWLAPAIWVSILAGLITFGGFLLLIIPGIIFAVWYVFSILFVVLEEKRGLAALRASKELVVGRWGAVLWRIFAPGLFFGFIYMLFVVLIGVAGTPLINLEAESFTGEMPLWWEIAAQVLIYAVSAAFAPLWVVPAVILYRDLKSHPSVVMKPASPATPAA